MLLTFYHVGLFVHRLHHHHVSALVDPADRRLQLHLVAQLFGHELADLTGAARKLPLLWRWNEKSRSQSLRRLKPQTAGVQSRFLKLCLLSSPAQTVTLLIKSEVH